MHYASMTGRPAHNRIHSSSWCLCLYKKSDEKDVDVLRHNIKEKKKKKKGRDCS